MDTSKKILLETAIEQFLVFLENKDASTHTVVNYKSVLTKLQNYLEGIEFNGACYMDEIQLEHLENYFRYRKEQGNCSKTRKNIQIILRSFYRFACEHDLIDTNITLKLSPIKAPKKERIYLTEEESALLIDTIENPCIKVIAMTIYYSGLRVSEIEHLLLTDVDFHLDEIHVIQGKGKKDRTIPLHPVLKDAMIHYIENDRNPVSDRFFSSKNSGKISACYINDIIMTAASKAGIYKKSNVTAHILRHSFASRLVKHHCDIVSIQKLMGHTDLKTTSIYLHLNKEELKKAIYSIS